MGEYNHLHDPQNVPLAPHGSLNSSGFVRMMTKSRSTLYLTRYSRAFRDIGPATRSQERHFSENSISVYGRVLQNRQLLQFRFNPKGEKLQNTCRKLVRSIDKNRSNVRRPRDQ